MDLFGFKKKSPLIQTEFKEREWSYGKKENNNIDEKKYFGEDKYLSSLNQQTTISADTVFKERFDEVIPNKESLKTKISDTYSSAFRNKSVSSMTKGKRADAAKDKIELQRHLRKENLQLIKRHKEEQEVITKRSSQKLIESIDEAYPTPELKAAARELATTGMGGDIDNTIIENNGIFSENPIWRLNATKDYLTKIAQIPISTFDYSSDREFASEYAKKYEILRKADAIRTIFNSTSREDRVESVNRTFESVADVEAKLECLSMIKTDYENRMKLISSPYYALLAKKDIKSYLKKTDEELEASINDKNLIDYIKLYRTLEESPVGKKNKAQEFHNNTLVKRNREQWRDYSVNRVREKLGDFKSSEDEDGKAALKRFADETREKALASYPEDDYEFIEKVAPLCGLVQRMETPERHALEKKLVNICRSGKINDVEIAPEHLEQLKKDLKKLADARRAFLPVFVMQDKFEKVIEGLNCDLDNPLFKETDEAKLLKKLMSGSNSDGHLMKIANDDLQSVISNERANLGRAYANSISDMVTNISIYGYVLFPKYDEKMHNEKKVNESLENAKKSYTEYYYQKHPLKDGEKAVEKELPNFILNGKSYPLYGATIYGYINSFNAIEEGKDYKLEGKDGEELKNLLEKVLPQIKDATVCDDLYRADDGEKSLFHISVMDGCRKRTKADCDRINELVNKLTGHSDKVAEDK